MSSKNKVDFWNSLSKFLIFSLTFLYITIKTTMRCNNNHVSVLILLNLSNCIFDSLNSLLACKIINSTCRLAIKSIIAKYTNYCDIDSPFFKHCVFLDTIFIIYVFCCLLISRIRPVNITFNNLW